MPPFQHKIDQLQDHDLPVADLPFDRNASFARGAAGGPRAVWRAFRSPSANTFAENGLDIGTHPRLRRLGPLPCQAYLDIEAQARRVLARTPRLLSLGGDHSVTYPLLRAFAGVHRGITLLQLDAHPDTYDAFEGNRYSHACPFARIMEEGLARRLVQVGIRTQTAHQRRQAERFGIEQPEWRDGLPDLSDLEPPLYLSLDLDVLDPAFAPGVSHHEPGGLSVREVLRVIQGLQVPLVGADIVELNPRRDQDGRTAMVAAKFFREMAAHMLTFPLHP